MRKVRITAERQYFKKVIVEIEIPDNVDQEHLDTWLWDNEDKYDWKVKNKFVDTKHILDGELLRYDEFDSEGIPTYGGHL